jgi:hypothetical protein
MKRVNRSAGICGQILAAKQVQADFNGAAGRQEGFSLKGDVPDHKGNFGEKAKSVSVASCLSSVCVSGPGFGR